MMLALMSAFCCATIPAVILSVVYLLVRWLLELAILADCPPLAVPGATVAAIG